MTGENINQAELARVATLGQQKQQTEDPAGGENAMMELLTGAFNRIATMAGKAGVPGTDLANSSLTTGVQAGMESPDGFAGKQVRPSQNLSGADGVLQKIWQALMKSGIGGGIKDSTEGIGAPESVSMASLGTFTPDYTPSTEIGRGAGVSYDIG